MEASNVNSGHQTRLARPTPANILSSKQHSEVPALIHLSVREYLKSTVVAVKTTKNNGHATIRERNTKDWNSVGAVRVGLLIC